MLVQTPRLPQTSRLELASIQAKGAGDTHTERYTGVLPGCRGQAEALSWLGARHGCVEGFTIARCRRCRISGEGEGVDSPIIRIHIIHIVFTSSSPGIPCQD